MSLINLVKIAEALEANISQLFDYVNDENELTDMDLLIQEIVDMLRGTSLNNIQLSRNIVKELLREPEITKRKQSNLK
ncbi:hypothetical protein [Paenibacillus barcinonensis]|uniref:hypothetical protein n=1 Tax=Paenibacillus barcinonensis TaxID=198119 RepID=UPI003F59480E